MTPHRRLAVAALVATATLVAAELVGRVLAPALALSPQWPDRATEVKVAQMAAQPCTDVVFVGNSMARDGLDPASWQGRDGRRAYNSSLDAAGVDQVSAWLEDQVVPALDPEVVVWAIASQDLDPTAPAGRAAGEAYLSSPGGRRDFAGRVQRAMGDHLTLIRHRKALSDPRDLVTGVRDLLGGRQATRPAVDGLAGVIGPQGQGLSRRELHYQPGDPVTTSFVRRQLLGEGRPSPRSVQAVVATVKSLRAGGRQVVLVTMPVTDEFVDLHPQGTADWDDYRAAMQEISVTTGAPWLDLDDLQALSSLEEGSVFADTHHLNARGAAATTATLAQAAAGELGPTSRCGALP